MACPSLKSYSVSANLGIIKIQSCNKGLHSLHFTNEHEKIHITINSNFLPEKTNLLHDLAAIRIINWLDTYFYRPIELDNVDQPPICPLFRPKKSSFTEAVWNAMAQKVKFGQTISYQQLAEIAGHPGASRAVGNVMRRNNFLLLHPCHRVIKSDGTIGNFTAGNISKQKLLLHESAEFNS